MTTENDNKIKDLLALIEKKRSTLGKKPQAVWNTNGILKFGNETANINTINSIETCVTIAARLLAERGNIEQAHEFLGVSESKSGTAINDMLEDLKLRVEIIQYDEEKKKLVAMEAKLKDLRSVDLKTADTLNDITSLLS